ncbi:MULTISPECIES: (2Fe-2S)-binding protein [unclassified Pseudomonas]|uniref:(2Fe-2S)-binding protein n=1 Tax=unclassified Pseudomonas TaxID=196821 RepID=UPI0008C4A2C5|nr:MULTISPECIES: (2Fe-2S)-binding protein [unclassified Pseudomonas]NRH41081.1 (2Fe-2S)-binding protein [Pseudomonas sp. MS15a(2019)]SEP38794.1 2Fe-2S iron-sulfur cluster binding domain-containing protein [Pseudomonas sp. Snoq117.2]
MTSRFQRLAETGRPQVSLTVDGLPVTALVGDTLMVALLANGPALRRSEFGDERRAGFCLMGACQDCWVWTAEGERLRACGTEVREGLQILTAQPEAIWNLA